MAYLSNYSANSQYVVKAFSALFGSGVTGDLIASGDTILTASTSKTALVNVLLNNSVVLNSFPLYGANITDTAFVGALLDNMTKGSGVDATTLTDWKAAVTAALPSYPSRAAAVATLIDAVTNYSGTDTSLIALKTVIDNRAEVGAYNAQHGAATFSTLAALQSQTASVDTTAASVTAAQTGAKTGSTFTLTASQDNVIGTADNDTIRGDHTTLQATDVIKGGAGVDTLEYTDASTSATGTVPAALVDGVEIVNVRNVNGSAAVAATKESVTLTFNNFTHSTGAGATDGSVTVGATIMALTADKTGADIATYFSANVPAGYVFTSLNGNQLVLTASAAGAKTDLSTSQVLGTGGTTNGAMTAPTVAIVQGADAVASTGVTDTVNATNFVGATDFNSNLSTNAVIFDKLAAGQKIGLIGNGSVQLGDVTANYNSAATASVINVSNGVGPTGTTAPNVTVTGTAGVLTAATINSTGAANKINNLVLNGSETSLTVNAATNFTVGGAISGTGALKTATVAGAASSVTLGTLAGTLTSVDASGLTAGGVKVGIGSAGAASATSFKGGAGNDTVTIAAGGTVTSTIDAGAGTGDILSISDTAAGADTTLTSATAGKFVGFDILRVASNTGTAADVVTFDASLLSGLSAYQVGASTSSTTLSNLAAAPVVTVVGTQSASTNLTLGFKTPSGTNTDTATVNIDNQNTATIGTVNGLTVAKITAGTSVSTLNIGSNGSIINGGTQNVITTLNPADTALNKVVITGSQPLSLTTGALTKSITIDGSAATGSLSINASAVDSAVVTGAAYTNINGGTANDTIATGVKYVGTQTVFGGTGGDTITLNTAVRSAGNVDSLVYKTGADSLLDATGTAGASGTSTANTGKMDVVTGFVSGTDKIDITAFNTVTAQKGVADKGAFASLTAAITALNGSATAFNDATNTQRVAAEFHVGGDTYVLVDVDHNGTFNAATDLGIKLVGTAAVVAADFLA